MIVHEVDPFDWYDDCRLGRDRRLHLADEDQIRGAVLVLEDEMHFIAGWRRVAGWTWRNRRQDADANRRAHCFFPVRTVDHDHRPALVEARHRRKPQRARLTPRGYEGRATVPEALLPRILYA